MRPLFADLALVAFLLSQVLDGAFTYLGISLYGPSIEGNPIVGWLMSRLGQGPTLTAIKVTASTLGITLHLISVHRVVAVLALLYMGAAVLPWAAILYLD